MRRASTAMLLALLACALRSPSAHAEQPNRALLEAIENLRDDESWKTRMESAVFLGRSSDIRARRPLERALGDPHYAVRSAAIRGLTHLGDVRSIPPILDLFGDEEPFVRLEARRGLDRFELDDAYPYLIHALGRHSDPRVRLAAAERLADSPRPETMEALLGATGDRTQAGRFAVSSIRSLPEKRAVAIFSNGLKHRDYRVQIACIKALADMDAPGAAEAVIEMLDSRVPEVTLAAHQALFTLKKRIDETKYFVMARRARSRFERARALKVLGVLGGEEATKLLLVAIDDQDVLVRGAAVAGLGAIGDTRAIDKLMEMKKHEENARIIKLVRTTLAYLQRIRDEGDPASPGGPLAEED